MRLTVDNFPARESRLASLRHELTGRVRYRGVHALERIPRERRLRWAERAREIFPPSGVVMDAVGAWYGRAPLTIAGGPAAGMFVSTEHLHLGHAHLGVILRGDLEMSVYRAMIRTLKPGDVFYDVGANMGYFSLVAARMVGPAGRVVAFEPVPECAEGVRRNLALNDLGHASVLEVAVGDRVGRAELQVVTEASQSVLCGLTTNRTTREVIEVEITTLDALVGAGTIAPPDVVKLDVEGAELLILRGMRKTLAAHGPMLICEVHGEKAAFAALIDDLGYRSHHLDGPFPVAETPGEQIHVLAEPKR